MAFPATLIIAADYDVVATYQYRTFPSFKALLTAAIELMPEDIDSSDVSRFIEDSGSGFLTTDGKDVFWYEANEAEARHFYEVEQFTKYEPKERTIKQGRLAVDNYEFTNALERLVEEAHLYALMIESGSEYNYSGKYRDEHEAWVVLFEMMPAIGTIDVKVFTKE